MPLKELTRPQETSGREDDARRLLDGLDLDPSLLRPNPGRNAFGRLIDGLVPAGTGVDEYDEARRQANIDMFYEARRRRMNAAVRP